MKPIPHLLAGPALRSRLIREMLVGWVIGTGSTLATVLVLMEIWPCR